MFQLGSKRIRITEDDLNEVLGFPTENFVDDPNPSDIIAFFHGIQCNTTSDGNIPGVMYISMLPKEWNLFFNILSYVFSSKTAGFHGLTKPVQMIGYAVANNLGINFGRLIMRQITKKLGSRNCLYPRFLQLVLNRKLTGAQLATFPNTNMREPAIVSSVIIPRLENQQDYPNNHRAVLTDHLQDYLTSITMPTLPPNNLQEPLGEEEAEVEAEAEEEVNTEPLDSTTDRATTTETGTEILEGQDIPESETSVSNSEIESYHPGSPTGTDPNSKAYFLHLMDLDDPHTSQGYKRFSKILGDEIEFEHQQIHNTVVEPNTQTQHTSLLPLKRKLALCEESEGVSASSAPNKDVFVVHPATLPPTKDRNIETEETSTPSVSSQQDIEMTKAHKQSLGSSSQQGDPIEIRLSARASVGESPLQTQPDIIHAQSEVAHTKVELTETTSDPTILQSGLQVEGSSMNQESSQTLREGFDPNAKSTGSLSNSPGGTFLDPAGKGSDVGSDRQLSDSESDSSDELDEVMSLQTLEGEPGSMLDYGPESNLPEIPTLDPQRDVSSSGKGSDVGADRQLSDSESDELDEVMSLQTLEGEPGSMLDYGPESNLPEIPTLDPQRDVSSSGDWQLVLYKDGDSRTPIAPPVTSLRMATVISSAGTAGAKDSEGTSETRTELVSETQTQRPSEHRVMSETPAELISETPTIPQITPQIATVIENLQTEVKDLKQSLEEVKEEQRAQRKVNDEFQAMMVQKIEDLKRSMELFVKQS